MMVMAIAELQKLHSPSATSIFIGKLEPLAYFFTWTRHWYFEIEELESLFIGQSLYLHWKYQVQIPIPEEYNEMTDKRAGGLFRLCVRFMQAESSKTSIAHLDPTAIVRMLSIYFQTRDDYQNLVSDQYAKEKGFAEDLDEGKISLPIIYTLQLPAHDERS